MLCSFKKKKRKKENSSFHPYFLLFWNKKPCTSVPSPSWPQLPLGPAPSSRAGPGASRGFSAACCNPPCLLAVRKPHMPPGSGSSALPTHATPHTVTPGWHRKSTALAGSCHRPRPSIKTQPRRSEEARPLLSPCVLLLFGFPFVLMSTCHHTPGQLYCYLGNGVVWLGFLLSHHSLQPRAGVLPHVSLSWSLLCSSDLCSLSHVGMFVLQIKKNKKNKVFKYHKMEEKQKKFKMECSVYIKATVSWSVLSFLLD